MMNNPCIRAIGQRLFSTTISPMLKVKMIPDSVSFKEVHRRFELFGALSNFVPISHPRSAMVQYADPADTAYAFHVSQHASLKLDNSELIVTLWNAAGRNARSEPVAPTKASKMLIIRNWGEEGREGIRMALGDLASKLERLDSHINSAHECVYFLEFPDIHTAATSRRRIWQWNETFGSHPASINFARSYIEHYNSQKTQQDALKEFMDEHALPKNDFMPKSDADDVPSKRLIVRNWGPDVKAFNPIFDKIDYKYRSMNDEADSPHWILYFRSIEQARLAKTRLLHNFREGSPRRIQITYGTVSSKEDEVAFTTWSDRPSTTLEVIKWTRSEDDLRRVCNVESDALKLYPHNRLYAIQFASIEASTTAQTTLESTRQVGDIFVTRFKSVSKPWQNSKSVYMVDLPRIVPDSDLHEVLQKFGRVQTITHEEHGTLVEFCEASAASSILKVGFVKLLGQEVGISRL